MGGGDTTHPTRFETKGVLKLSGKTRDCSRRVIAIGGAFLDPRSKFDPIFGGQMSIFCEIGNFST